MIFADPSRIATKHTKKFDGRPASIAFCLNVALLRMPVLAVLLSRLNGNGLRAARNACSVAFVQFAPLYADPLTACDAGCPFRYASRMGSGEVPGAPVYAKVAPRPAAMFAARLACAFLNSLRKPFSKMSISLTFTLANASRARVPTYRTSTDAALPNAR